MTAYYNEFDPYAAQWLRNLIKAGHIAPGYVDERSIVDVKPEDLTEFTQCHFFAGIGTWSLALRNAGWPDDKPVWTGSCPCQPFSAAGNQLGTADERHLAPVWLNLIKECQPAALFGEQVAAAIGKHWLDDLFTELEEQGYACGAAVLPACGVGAPHIRQRLWFGANRMANADSSSIYRDRDIRARGRDESSDSIGIIGLADSNDNRQQSGTRSWSDGRDETGNNAGRCGEIGRVANADGARSQTWLSESKQREKRKSGKFNNCGCEFCREQRSLNLSRPTPTNGYWRDADWLGCRDGKWRPVEPGTFPLAHGIANRVGRLRAYGNSIVPQAATIFIEAFECSIEE